MIAKLNSEIKEAMKAKNKERLTTLRSLLSEAKNIAIDDKRREASDEDLLKAVTKGIKQRKDSIEQYEEAGRTDLAEVEKFELSVLEEFQPEQMSEEEITTIVKEIIAAVGASSKADMGKVMGALMPKVKGKADGSLVSKIVNQQLS